MVKTDSRNKKNYQVSRLPIQTAFHEDESINSWMIRAALNQGCSPLIFTQYYWGNHRLWTYDLDKGFDYIDSAINKDISKLASIDIEKMIEFHTLYKFYKHMEYGGDYYKKNTSWIVPLAKRNRLSFLGYQYCPICFLNENLDPYLRVNWRFTWNIFCLKHKVLLQNRCYSCGEVYQPQLIEISKKNINHCSSCNKKLEVDESQQIFDIKMKYQAYEFQLKAQNVYLNGFGEFLGQELKFKDWFQNVLFFLNIIRKGCENPNYMFGKVLNEFKIPLDKIKLPLDPLGINYLPIISRCELFSILELLLKVSREQWVETLIKYNVKQNSFYWSKNMTIPIGFYSIYQYLPNLTKVQPYSRVSNGIKSKKTISKEWKALEKKFKRMEFYEKRKPK